MQRRHHRRQPACPRQSVRVLHPHLQSRHSYMDPYRSPQVRSVLAVLMELLSLCPATPPTLWMKLPPIYHFTTGILHSRPGRELIRIVVCPRNDTYVVPLTFGIFAAAVLRGASPDEFMRCRFSSRATMLVYQLLYHPNYSFISVSQNAATRMPLPAGDTDYDEFVILISKQDM